MKTSTFTLVLSLVIISSGRLCSQDLSGLFPFAHYPLVNTADDALGLQNPMVLINTVYEGADGIFCNGKHPVVDQGGAWARTTYMSALFDPKFAVQVEFKIEDLDGQVRCMVVCGLNILQQYLGLFVNDFGDFTILLSNGVFVDLPDVTPQENLWYKFTMIYDTVTNNAKFYFGNNLVESAMHELVRATDDAFVSNYFPAAGYPLKGNWRNLRIYGSEEVTALEDELDRTSALRVFPNPGSESLMIDAADDRAKKWTIYHTSGIPALQGDIQHKMQIDISPLLNGQYVLILRDVDGRVLGSKSFCKM